jgi:CHRD domain-containing protein
MRARFFILGLTAVGILLIPQTVSSARRRPATLFLAILSGKEEVPRRVTPARGLAKFEVNGDGTIDFKLSVVNIENITAAHIHLGPPGVNGPIVAFLFGDAPPGGGPLEGRIADGTLMQSDLIPRANVGFNGTLPELLARMRAGGAYVNVHTNDGAAPPDTGPGDFPGGEIRGQIRPVGPP